jgi:hypothetical protein
MKRFVLRTAVVASCTFAGALWLYWRGPVPVVTATGALPQNVPTWYMLMPFPVFGLLLADVLYTYRSCGLECGVLELTIIVIIASLRLTYRIPVSGHALLLAYFIVRKTILGLPFSAFRWVEICIAAVLYLSVVYYKLSQWHDPVTLVNGTAVALVVATVSFWLNGRKVIRQDYREGVHEGAGRY